MNNDELKELAAVLNGIADGKKWETQDAAGVWRELSERCDPVYIASKGWKIRLKQWHLPDPPEGYEWHRTDWTEEMLPEGRRPLLLGESIEYNDELSGYEKQWIKITTRVGEIIEESLQSRYRTRRPLPPPKPQLREVQLCADDVPPGSVFRFNGDGDGHHYSPTLVAGPNDGVYFTDTVQFKCDWSYLMEHAMVNRSIPMTGKWDATAWEKCSKMEEVPA